jgi:molecular chaperone GrpE
MKSTPMANNSDHLQSSGMDDACEVDARSDEPDGSQSAETLESALAEMTDRWTRSEAEIANVRARAKRDVEDARRFAVQKFATEVVEVAENLQRGLQRLPPASAQESDSMAGVRAGLIEIERGFVSVLERNGIKRDDPKGTVFDPNLHQAMAEQEVAGIKPGTILETLAPTWTLNDRLLRAAMVVIAKPAPTVGGSSAPLRDPPR